MSAMMGDCYIWDNNRDSALLYFDKINTFRQKNENENLYILSSEWIPYNDIDSTIKYVVENFDTGKIEKNTTLGGHDIIISRIIKNGKIESHHFFE